MVPGPQRESSSTILNPTSSRIPPCRGRHYLRRWSWVWMSAATSAMLRAPFV